MSRNPIHRLDDEEETKDGKQYFYWRNGDRYGVGGVGRTALGVIKNFIEQHPNMDAAALQQEFFPLNLGTHERVRLKIDIPPDELQGTQAQYFGQDSIPLQNREISASAINGARPEQASRNGMRSKKRWRRTVIPSVNVISLISAKAIPAVGKIAANLDLCRRAVAKVIIHKYDT